MVRGRDRWHWQRLLLVVAGAAGLVVLAMLWIEAPAYVHAKHGGDPSVAVSNTRTGIATAMAGFIAFTGVVINMAEVRRANENTRRANESCGVSNTRESSGR